MTATMKTTIQPVDPSKIGQICRSHPSKSHLEAWHLEPPNPSTKDFERLSLAAHQLRDGDTPVAFPTETVYGLGADATRSAAVQGIYKAKQRPSDNPLIVHVASLAQLHKLLGDGDGRRNSIPPIYQPLIERFWPGPLTILLPLPSPSPLAPEVFAGLSTFGVRIPRNAIALALIRLADRPVAAPSANASTKPSPTAAEHVKDDLDGRLETIIDGGPCDVGVESTVVDGLSSPPAILRPGGISLEQLRACPGWEGCIIGYKDKAQGSAEGDAKGSGPRAPGMKYRHYSPNARVILYEAGSSMPSSEDLFKGIDGTEAHRVGIIRTSTWPEACGHANSPDRKAMPFTNGTKANGTVASSSATMNGKRDEDALIGFLPAYEVHAPPAPETFDIQQPESNRDIQVLDIDLGDNLEQVARGLFSALRELDRKHVDVIHIEGVDERRGDVAAAIMNRLRKAAEQISPA